MAMALFFNIFVTCFLCVILSVKVSTTDPKIVGGVEAGANQFPYQVSLKYNNQHNCGGSIVDASHVVTAAHCVCNILTNGTKIVLPVNTLTVNVGNISRSAGDSHSIEQIYVHEKFSITTAITNDIAILKISGKFNFNGTVKPIDIAETKYSPGANCTISGWGITIESGHELPEKLRYANVQIVNITTCNAWINTTLTNDMLCAGTSAGGIDSCQGDSGGPLVCNNTLTGIVSHGIGCARPKQPGIYSDVEFHNKWISDVLKGSSTVIVSFTPLMFIIIFFNLYST